MAKILRVIESFFIMEVGDTFEWSADDKMYVSKHNEEFYKTDAEKVDEIKSSYNSEFKISENYAKSLLEDGYLEEVTEKTDNTFVNVFDEIDNLLIKYQNSLKLLKNETDLPACLKVERETVLTNLITLLEHLKSLKK